MERLLMGRLFSQAKRGRWLAGGLLGVLAMWPAAPVRADALADATVLLRKGNYDGARTAADAGIKAEPYIEAWWRLDAEALLDQGRYQDAYTLLVNAIRYAPDSIRLRLLYRQACLYTQRESEAAQMLDSINSILTAIAARQQYTQAPLDSDTLAAAGDAALMQGMDPRTVLERFFDPAEQATTPVRDAFLSAGRLALDKHDFDLASRNFGNGLKAFPADADLLWGMAAAFRESDRDKFADYANQALAANPNHVPTLLLVAENLIDMEDYDQAFAALGDILKINPHEPAALALLSAIAQLRNDPDQADAYRNQALATWKDNPRVDYDIGLKLSMNYRFILGAEAQTRALDRDPTFTPARDQLAQDLLRLGLEDEGWAMAAMAHQADGYDVEAFNLVTLHDEISKYTVIKTPHYTLVMEPQEALVYGPRVQDLIERARTYLTAKYGLDLDFPVLIEVFPNPSDFSVRTFSMPDIGEFLGVTFGSVVTLNSPSTHLANWEDVLWHEFTHVVSLTKTHNRMPRWLSEGISVYEECTASPAWGQTMTPDTRERILNGKMQPISGMSGAFLQAKNVDDTEFAYFESMLVVKYLVDHYGLDHLKSMLTDIGSGVSLNDAFAKNFAPVAQLDADFSQYARAQASSYGGGFSFTPPTTPGSGVITPVPDQANFYTRIQGIEDMIQQEEWPLARAALEKINATGLYVPGPDNPYLLLAQVCAKMNDTAAEKAALTTVTEHEGDAMDAVTRLLQIARDAKDWPAVAHWGDALVAIHPMAPDAWRALLDGQEQLGDKPAAIEAGQALLQLDPPDLASIHYRLARLMLPNDMEGARRQDLQALEEAPRFRAAYELLNTIPPAAAASAANTP
jgi:tetratricopeptide (TPR) repeat protein